MQNPTVVEEEVRKLITEFPDHRERLSTKWELAKNPPPKSITITRENIEKWMVKYPDSVTFLEMLTKKLDPSTMKVTLVESDLRLMFKKYPDSVLVKYLLEMVSDYRFEERTKKEPISEEELITRMAKDMADGSPEDEEKWKKLLKETRVKKPEEDTRTPIEKSRDYASHGIVSEFTDQAREICRVAKRDHLRSLDPFLTELDTIDQMFATEIKKLRTHLECLGKRRKRLSDGKKRITTTSSKLLTLGEQITSKYDRWHKQLSFGCSLHDVDPHDVNTGPWDWHGNNIRGNERAKIRLATELHDLSVKVHNLKN